MLDTETCQSPVWAVNEAVELLQRLTGPEEFIDRVLPVILALRQASTRVDPPILVPAGYDLRPGAINRVG